MGNSFYYLLSIWKKSLSQFTRNWVWLVHDLTHSFVLLSRPTSWLSPGNDERLSSSQEPATWCTSWWRRRILRRNDVSAASSLWPVLNLPLRVSCHARAFIFMYMGSIFISCTLSLSDNLRINKKKTLLMTKNLPMAPLDVCWDVWRQSLKDFCFLSLPFLKR